MSTKNQKPAISIVTPSYNMLSQIQLCHASILDQNIDCEHVISDGNSTDGTKEWLQRNDDIVSVSEKDRGMYHALNKAIDMSRADIIGHLNCDEQYLPGTLQYVKKFFDENPSVDFLVGNFLVIDNEGEFVAYRKSFKPRWPYFFSNYLYTTTCTLFYRRRIFDEVRFDENYKSIADVIFLYNVIKKGFKGVHRKKYFSVFTYSGTNLSLDPISTVEKKRFNKTLPQWYKLAKPFFFFMFFIERILNGTYSEKSSLSYAIFAKSDLVRRVTKMKENPGFRLRFKRSIITP